MTSPDSTTSPEYFWSPKGRISRSAYSVRLFCLVAGLVSIIVIFGQAKSLFGGILFIVLLFGIVLQVIKRSRDGYGSGWWALLLCFPPATGVLILSLTIKGTADQVEQPNPV